jgi:23S rRNA pseudouridine2605 synthase
MQTAVRSWAFLGYDGSMESIRLNKYLAQQGVASRRAIDQMIVDGKISVNGETVSGLGIKIDPDKDKVLVSGKSFKPPERLVYILLNKPEGYVASAKKTEQAPAIVLDLVKVPERIFPIGRLDKDTSGLLLLTNDGDLALKLTHPRYESDKEYEVMVKGNITPEHVREFEKGVSLWGRRTNPAKVEVFASNQMRLTITEGKNRQIRRMCDKLGIPVITLRRVRIKNLRLGQLSLGHWRYLKPEEVEALKK